MRTFTKCLTKFFIKRTCETVTKTDFRDYKGLIEVKRDTQKRLKKIMAETAKIEKRMTSRKRPRDKDGNILDLNEVLTERIRAENELLGEIEKRTLAIELALANAAPRLTPLELLLMTKLYIEGLSWKEVIELLQHDEQYVRFCYERTTYMRAHKRALEKIAENEGVTNGQDG